MAIGLWVKGCHDDNVRKDNINAERVAKRQELHARIEFSAKTANAITNWRALLANGRRDGIIPVFTADIQNIWLTGRPILFIGTVKDISLIPNDQYQLIIEQNIVTIAMADDFHTDWPKMFDSRFEVVLVCDSNKIRPMQEVMHASKKIDGPQIAAITAIDHISNGQRQDSEGNVRKIYTGYGNCLDLFSIDSKLQR